MKYYKITLPNKVYVAKAPCLSALAYNFYDQFSFNEADNTSQGNEFLAFELLEETCYTVNGVCAIDALDAEMILRAEKLKGVYVVDIPSGKRHLASKDIIVILEADPIPETEFDKYIAKIHDKSNVCEVIQWNQ